MYDNMFWLVAAWKTVDTHCWTHCSLVSWKIHDSDFYLLKHLSLFDDCVVNNQLELGELFAAGEFVELEAVELDDGADAAAAALFAFANKREANGFGHASTCNIDD